MPPSAQGFENARPGRKQRSLEVVISYSNGARKAGRRKVRHCSNLLEESSVLAQLVPAKAAGRRH